MEQHNNQSTNTLDDAAAADDECTIPNLTKITTLPGHSDMITVVKFSHNGKLLASGALNNCIKIWDVNLSQLHKDLFGHKRGAWDLSWSHDNTLLVSTSMDRTLKIWDVLSGKCLKTLRGPQSGVYRCAFNPSSFLIAGGSDNAEISVWDVKTGNLIKSLEKSSHNGKVSSICFNKEGTFIIVGTTNGMWCIWDLASERCLGEFIGDVPIMVINVFPRGDGMLVATFRSYAQFWNLSNSVEDIGCFKILPFNDDDEYISVLENPTDGDLWIISKSKRNKVLNIWNLTTGEIVNKIKYDVGEITCGTYHIPTNTIAVAESKKITVWKCDNNK